MKTPRVVKIGGRAQSDERLPAAIARAVAGGASICIVHGGGDEVTQLQRRLGSEPTFVRGRRVTTDDDLALVRMVLSGSVNKRLVGELLAASVRAVGISGEDGGLLRCRVFGDGELGAVGEPESSDPALLATLMEADFVPVVSPLGRFADGRGCNVNGDDAAAALAASIGAEELILVADVPGVLASDGTVITNLDRAGVDALIADGTARGGMIAKLEAARRALSLGVPRVRIGDLTAIGDPTRGTSVAVERPSVPTA